MTATLALLFRWYLVALEVSEKSRRPAHAGSVSAMSLEAPLAWNELAYLTDCSICSLIGMCRILFSLCRMYQ